MAPRVENPANDPKFKWKKGDDGIDIMPELQKEFMEWLVNPLRVPATQVEWASLHDIEDRTVRRWKADPRFVKEWRAKAAEMNVSPERIQAVVDNMWKIAAQGTGPAAVKAGETYLKFVQLFIPTSKVVVADESLDKLSDEDLARLAGWAQDSQDA
jgi:hypothetical protein